MSEQKPMRQVLFDRVQECYNATHFGNDGEIAAAIARLNEVLGPKARAFCVPRPNSWNWFALYLYGDGDWEHLVPDYWPVQYADYVEQVHGDGTATVIKDRLGMPRTLGRSSLETKEYPWK